MKRLRTFGLMAIVAIACGVFAAGCSGGADEKPIPSDPALNDQPAAPTGMSEGDMPGKKGGG